MKKVIKVILIIIIILQVLYLSNLILYHTKDYSIIDLFRPYNYMIGVIEKVRFGEYSKEMLLFKQIKGIDAEGNYIFDSGHFDIPGKLDLKEGDFIKITLDHGASIMSSSPATIRRVKDVEILNEEELQKEINKMMKESK